MGASVQPVPAQGGQPSPSEIARIQGNVAKMRAQGAPDSDVVAYLQHEDSLASAAPTPPDESMWRGVGRSLVQGATYGFGDEMGLTSRDKENAFKAQHPVADFLSKMVGGSVAPIAAMAAAPELLAGAGGAAILGGTTGALSGAGEADGSLGDRAQGAAIGGLLGAATGAAGYGAGRMVGKGASAIADRISPERAVARGAAGLLDPGIKGRLAEVDAIAPGGGSIATTAVPAEGAKVSRMLPMLRAVGASPAAGARAEASIIGQRATLDAARKGIGAQMNQLSGDVPVTPELRGVLSTVRTALGAKTPNVRAADVADVNPLGLEKSEPFAFDPEAKTLSVGELRDALSRLRFMSRGAVKRGLEANGVDTRNIGQARAALQSYLYDPNLGHPEFAQLDRNYAIASNQMRQTDLALKTVQRSRANYSANQAYGATSGSLGGSLPSGRHGVAMSLLDNILTDRAGAADAVARLIAKPGGPALVDQILSNVPKAPGKGASKYVAPLTAGAIPALRGLLSPAQP